jgi:predicted metal-dependent hydrolase
MWLSGRSEALTAESGLPVPIEIRAVRGARRLRLRFDDTRGILKLTCPHRTSRRAALTWALDQRHWIEAQIARALPAEPFLPDAMIPLEGVETRLVWVSGAPRAPQLVEGELRCGGPLSGFERRVEEFLKGRALDLLSAEVSAYSALADVNPRSVSVGDPGSRWGSCSSEGRIRLSWRLILAPPCVRRFVVAHEVAHLVHLNHGPDFKALEARLYGPGLGEAKALLRRLGPRLRRLGRRG